ncbi:MAG: RNA polymerase recycling motor ATPase HelR [Kineosporiaceae bacterium]
MGTTWFALDGAAAAKAAPELIDDDDRHLAGVAATLDSAVAGLTERLEEVRRAPARGGQQALDRDQEVHRLTGRLRVLQRFGVEACLGRMVPEGGEPVYVGRFGLGDSSGRRLLVDWRSPAAEPFFAATRARPAGLESRRRYRWTRGRVANYWDEAFRPSGRLAVALDEDSALLDGLGEARTGRMRDVLATLQADQDAAVRAPSAGALVVDGGPGTGKTVVALHRAAYLLHADPRLGPGRGSVLVVGPHQPYLAYVADVLPSLGEEGVLACTVRDLVAEGAWAPEEADPTVAALKASSVLVDAVGPAVALYEEPPTSTLVVPTPWADIAITAEDWADAFAVPAPATPHHEARDDVWDALVEIVADRVEAPTEEVARALRADRTLVRSLDRAWPVLDAAELVGDLFTVPAYLRRCAPSLTPAEVAALQRADPTAWTAADLPLLDAARRRLGSASDAARRRRHEIEAAARRERMADVVEDLVAADDSELLVMSMLKVSDVRGVLDDDSADDAPTPDRLAGPFAHVVVDEAQELTDAQWRMLLARCPSRSFTIVGDRAQARAGFAESWRSRLERVGFDQVAVAPLTVNYRTPSEVMDEAAPAILAAVPDANVPTSIRSTGVPVRHLPAECLEAVLTGWLASSAAGTACVISAVPLPGVGAFGPRVRALTPSSCKGLEFDLVVLVEPASFGEGVTGAVDRYVAMTRATRELVVLSG